MLLAVPVVKLSSPQRFAAFAQVMEMGCASVPGALSAPFTMRSAPPLPPPPNAVPAMSTCVPGEIVSVALAGTVTSPVTLMTPLQVSLPASVPFLFVIAGAKPRLVIAFVELRPSTAPVSVKFPGSVVPPPVPVAVISQLRRWSLLAALLWTSMARVFAPSMMLATGKVNSIQFASVAGAMALLEIVVHVSVSSRPSAARKVPLK